MSDANLEVLIQIREELAGLNRTREQLKGAKDDANNLKTVLMQGLGIGGGIAIATGAVALLKNTLVGSVREALAFASATKDMSESLGISATKLQVLRLEFQKAGLDIGRLNMAITAQTQSLAEARDVSSSAAQAYRTLGLDAAKVEALPIEERLLAVTRAMDQAKDKTLAFQAAAQILGSRGLPQLLNAMRQLGIEGVDALERLYAKQGLLMSDDEMERLDRASKQWQKFWHGMVIGSGATLTLLDKIVESAEKSPAATLLALAKALAGGPTASGDLFAVLAQNTTPLASTAGQNGPGPAGPTFDSEAQKKADSDALKRSQKEMAAREAAEQSARDYAEALKREGEAIRISVRTPLEEYGETVQRLNQLHLQGAIDAETFARGVKQAADQLTRKEDAAMQRSLDAFFGPLDEQQRKLDDLRKTGTDFENAMVTMWGNVADRAGQTFADILMSGKASFSQLKDVIIRSLIEIMVKMAIINPIINGVMGMFGVATGLPTMGGMGSVTAAGGGSFLTSGPTTLTVGDNPGGIEMVNVVPLSGVGRSTVSGQAVQMAGGGSLIAGLKGGGARGGGGPITVSFNFATGVAATVRAEIMGMVPELRALATDAVREAHERNELRIT